MQSIMILMKYEAKRYGSYGKLGTQGMPSILRNLSYELNVQCQRFWIYG